MPALPTSPEPVRAGRTCLLPALGVGLSLTGGVVTGRSGVALEESGTVLTTLQVG